MPYVDLHCHILPGLDDGAATMEETLRFARRLDAEGVRDVAARRTSSARTTRLDIAELAGRRAAAQRAIDADGTRRPPASRAASSPTRTRSTLEPEHELALIAQGPEHAPWLLLECPFDGLDDVFDAAVARLTGLGYGLLLAHPERAAARARPARAPRRARRAAAGQRLVACSATTARRRATPRRGARAPAAAPTASPPTRTPARARRRSRSATARWPALGVERDPGRTADAVQSALPPARRASRSWLPLPSATNCTR